MNISEVTQQLSNFLTKASSLFLTANDNFTNQLTVGQILKGKMLRSYEGGRYLVDFDGHEKVVDSSVPLKTGELIYGRVVGLGDKVELKRLVISRDDKSSYETQISTDFLLSKWDMKLRDIMRDFQVKFSLQERRVVISMIKNSAHPEKILLSAIALTKHQLPISEDLLKYIAGLEKNNLISLLIPQQIAPKMGLTNEFASDLSMPTDVLAQFINEIKRIFDEQQAFSMTDFESDSGLEVDDVSDAGLAQDFESQNQFAMKWHLLNAQIDGAVQHRVATLPVWLGEQLVEVNIAIFEQGRHQIQAADIKFKKIVFSLELEFLGAVDIEMILNKKNIRLHISSGSYQSSQILLSHEYHLKKDLLDYNWMLDEIDYSTKSVDGEGNVIGAIVEHYASQDRLSCLM